MSTQHPGIVYLRDWSRVPVTIADSLLRSVQFSAVGDMDSCGLHVFQGEIWTGAYVGVRNLNSGRTRSKKFDELALMLEPRFGLDPWEMLEDIFEDPELETYLRTSEKSNDPLFKIFTGEKPVSVPMDLSARSEALLHLSFISSCFAICQKGLKKTMTKTSSNLTAKIRGRVNVSQNLKRNTFRGRNDRFYCEYPTFTENNAENRVLKAALRIAATALKGHVLRTPDIERRIQFCFSILKHVPERQVWKSEINSLNVSGLYSYYSVGIKQAVLIVEGGANVSSSLASENEVRDGKTLPFLINMQLLFELYCRTKIKEYLPPELEIDPYQWPLSVRAQGHEIRNLHIMNSLKPDIVIRDAHSKNVVLMLDAKYKQSSKTSRNDTLQLLAYSLNLAPKRAGFVFPGSSDTAMNEQSEVTLKTQFDPKGIPYSELFVTSGMNWQELLYRLTYGS